MKNKSLFNKLLFLLIAFFLKVNISLASGAPPPLPDEPNKPEKSITTEEKKNNDSTTEIDLKDDANIDLKNNSTFDNTFDSTFDIEEKKNIEVKTQEVDVKAEKEDSQKNDNEEENKNQSRYQNTDDNTEENNKDDYDQIDLKKIRLPSIDDEFTKDKDSSEDKNDSYTKESHPIQENSIKNESVKNNLEETKKIEDKKIENNTSIKEENPQAEKPQPEKPAKEEKPQLENTQKPEENKNINTNQNEIKEDKTKENNNKIKEVINKSKNNKIQPSEKISKIEENNKTKEKNNAETEEANQFIKNEILILGVEDDDVILGRITTEGLINSFDYKEYIEYFVGNFDKSTINLEQKKIVEEIIEISRQSRNNQSYETNFIKKMEYDSSNLSLLVIGYARKNDVYNLASLLYRQPYLIKIKDCVGNNLLQIALYNRAYDVSRYLINLGINLNNKSIYGIDAYKSSIIMDDKKTAELIFKAKK